MAIVNLGDAFDAGWRVRTKCQGVIFIESKLFGGCGQKSELSMETLVWTRGRDLSLALLPKRLKCPCCGSRDVRLLYDIPSEPGSAAASAQVWSTKELE